MPSSAYASRRCLADDVIVYDRGYYSFDLTKAHLDQNRHFVFRLKREVGTANPACGEIYRRRHRILLSDLAHQPPYDSSPFHHERWSIADLYLTNKNLFAVFHSQSERCVRQELYTRLS
ncbi:MAG: hypothetical protein OXC17_14275 [Aestuariivita sp.]|nr:hypothetical protein [Aestuariivita sp.]